MRHPTKTTEQFKQEVFDLVGSEYLVNSEYINSNEKIDLIHNIPTCMNTFSMKPGNFLYGQRCPKCRKTEKQQRERFLLQTNEELFAKEVAEQTNGEYEVIGEYSGNKKKIGIRHCNCDYIFYMTPDSFKRGQRCTNSQCKSLRHSKSCVNHGKNTFNKYFQPYVQEYEILDDYQGWHIKMAFKHKICGSQFQTSPNSFFNTSNNVYHIKCPSCLQQIIHNNRTKSKEQFQQEISLISNNEYIVLGNYVNNNTPILMEHLSCKNTWEAKPSNLLEGTGCPYCKKSKGERIIERYLTQNNICYFTQYKYDNLLGIGGRKLSYDFYLPEYKLLIEFQGKYHDGTASNQTFERFKVQQEHDKRKKNYAVDHNIKLLEIWYWDMKKIEKILKQVLQN